MKEVQILEQSMFDIIFSLHTSLVFKDLEDYRLGLAVLDSLNDEYHELTGQYFIPQDRVLDYHSKQWSFR